MKKATVFGMLSLNAWCPEIRGIGLPQRHGEYIYDKKRNIDYEMWW